MQNKKLPPFLLIGLLVLLTKNFIIKTFPKIRKWFQGKRPDIMNISKAADKIRYGRHSKRLWEEGPLCSETKEKYKFTYKSKYKNAYGDPVFYRKNEEPYYVSPITTGDVPGFFHAYPGGLNIDQQTGEIDVNGSDAGVRYTIEFTPFKNDCVVRTHVVISGIGYEGGIFSLSESKPEELIIKPFYFGSISETEEFPSDMIPSRPAPSGEFNVNPEPNRKPTADLIGLIMDPEKSANIDLKNTIYSGALGFRKNPDGWCEEFPENGVSKDFTIYYRLFSGPGEGILNKTKIRIHFYNTKEDMPDDLQVRIQQQNNSIHYKSLPWPLLLGIPFTTLPDSPWEVLSTLLAALSSFLFLMTKAKSSNHPLIPPEICVTK